MTIPRYRFWGKTAPTDQQRVSIVASAPEPKVSDGVATMRLYDPVDSWGGPWGVSAAEFVEALDSLADDVTEIRLHINSPGGEVFEGIAILNALRRHPARVVAIVDGLAASAASFIATGADEVVMAENTELMIHDAWGLAIGNAGDMRDMAGRLDQLSDNIASVYAKKAGGTVEDWRAAMLAETWYSAKEAVDAGLADRVEGVEPDDEEAAAKARFDLSIFTYAGRDEAPTPTAQLPEASEPTPASNPAEGEPTQDDSIALRHRVNARRSRARR